jgi:molybdate transport system ATP-binding protein
VTSAVTSVVNSAVTSPLIDLDFRARLSEPAGFRWRGRAANSRRSFELAVRFSSDAHSIAFFGPSGAGKSLTLQAIAGLLRVQAGHIRIAGRALFDARAGIDLAASQRSTGYLFQDYALFPHLSVKSNVAFGLTDWRRRRLSSTDAQHVDRLLEAFGLAPLAESRPAHLSGGQQQRVALARALACRPSLLLLDEPFAALNPMLRDALREELAAVRKQWNVPMLMISHDVDDVLALADVVCIFDNGRIVREIDLRNLQGWEPGQPVSSEVLRQELTPGPPAGDEPRRSRLRRMLLAAVPRRIR